MKKPYGRKTRKKVEKILLERSRKNAMEMLANIPDEQLTGHLFSHFYNKSELIKFRSIAAMGVLGANMSVNKIERARILLRRLMWNLNDESGGIGWGSPEAMGEILERSHELAQEFKSILFSYLDPQGNYIEHEVLQRGVLWGIGTFLRSCPVKDIPERTRTLLSGFLVSSDPVKRGYAFRAMVNAGYFDVGSLPDNIVADHSTIDYFDGWYFIQTRISDMISLGKNNKFV